MVVSLSMFSVVTTTAAAAAVPASPTLSATLHIFMCVYIAHFFVVPLYSLSSFTVCAAAPTNYAGLRQRSGVVFNLFLCIARHPSLKLCIFIPHTIHGNARTQDVVRIIDLMFAQQQKHTHVLESLFTKKKSVYGL